MAAPRRRKGGTPWGRPSVWGLTGRTGYYAGRRSRERGLLRRQLRPHRDVVADLECVRRGADAGASGRTQAPRQEVVPGEARDRAPHVTREPLEPRGREDALDEPAPVEVARHQHAGVSL